MKALSGKNVLFGITGGIAAYKSIYVVRSFIKAGAAVKVLLTPGARDFVTPLSLSTLSKNSVDWEFTKEGTGVWNNHVEYGKWADIMLIAPATANSISKMATGQADNLLLAAYLSADCPVYLAPAMDLDMYQHPTTKANLEKLKSFGNRIIPAESGELASGLTGQGRMAEPGTIFSSIATYFRAGQKLKGQKVLVTAGPTYEAIDPVRFLGNHSSGKMGFAIAERAALNGAEVILITGPTHLETNYANITTLPVVSTHEMYEAVHENFKKTDIAILAAAVSDYTPTATTEEKIKKDKETLSLTFKKTEDILRSLGEDKTGQFLVGFALETQNELENAKTKLKEKNLDLIILNSLRDEGSGFRTDTNKIKLVSPEATKDFPLKPKAEVAEDIISEIAGRLKSSPRFSK